MILIIRVADTHPCVTISPSFGGATQSERNVVVCHLWTLDDKKIEEVFVIGSLKVRLGPLKVCLVESNVSNDSTF